MRPFKITYTQTCKCTFKCPCRIQMCACSRTNTDNCANTSYNTHFSKSSHTHTHTHTLQFWQKTSLVRYQSFDGVLGSSTLLGEKCILCVCVCVFVVKSTLATVCLSISPVWQHWKELLFRGQPHPTLINNAVRATGRGGGGVQRWRETEGRGVGKLGGQGGHPTKPASPHIDFCSNTFSLH